MDSLGKRSKDGQNEDSSSSGESAKRLRGYCQPVHQSAQVAARGNGAVEKSDTTTKTPNTTGALINSIHHGGGGAESENTRLNNRAANDLPLNVPTTIPIWAHTRSALCDALPYLRCYQGGNYTNKGITQGVLIDGCGSKRDYIDGTVIITAIGGGRKTDAATGGMTLTADQAETIAYRALKRSQEQGVSVMVACGNENKILRLPYTYCVLGEYQVTDIWKEKFPDTYNGFSSWMVRMERVDFEEEPWFIDDSSHTYALGQYHCPEETCQDCNQQSKHIYTTGWTCLNFQCAKFCLFPIHINGGTQMQHIKSEIVAYSDDFLRQRTDYISSGTIKLRRQLIPDLPVKGKGEIGTEERFRKGIVCPQCHCCSRRVQWRDWKCENDGCSFTYKVDILIHTIEAIHKEIEILEKSRKRMVNNSHLIDEWSTNIAGYNVDFYNLPDESGKVCGTVIVLRATKEICALPNGPDELYISMQKLDLMLKRSGGYLSGGKREELINHFAMNWGGEYKFGVKVDTRSFSDAPKEILTGVSQLSWAQVSALRFLKEKIHENNMNYSKESMSLKPGSFNELLSLGYFEESRIKFHDDGEKELGPTVASLSLGSPSIMKFRAKAKNNIGPKGNSRNGGKPAIVSFPFNHGDMCIMHGTQIHKYYEHEVTPAGKLRFAMTCRYIRPEMMRNDEVRKRLATTTKFPYDTKFLAYRGICDEDVEDEVMNEGTADDETVNVNRLTISDQPDICGYHSTNQQLVVKIETKPGNLALMQSVCEASKEVLDLSEDNLVSRVPESARAAYRSRSDFVREHNKILNTTSECTTRAYVLQ